ncbi:MAG: Stringent starvation protein B [Salinarimonadaceae bacterium]|nr:MAG: Stringent starvation protein B [Salinarimonadaceae bacterium]
MTQDLIRYDLLVQDALKGVVRKVLGDATRDGLPGDHHFYVSFRTDFPGVRLSTRMREKYPQDMTIVLQHQFWDLAVTEHALEVGLSFSGVPERLLIPFDAMTGFFDPSVQFGLKFEIQEPPALAAPASLGSPVSKLRKAEPIDNDEKGEEKGHAPRGAASEPEVAEPARATPARSSSKAKSSESATKSGAEKAKAGKGEGKVAAGKSDADNSDSVKVDGKGEGDGKSDGKGDGKNASKKAKAGSGEQDEQTSGAEVVSLDAFRKK